MTTKANEEVLGNGLFDHRSKFRFSLSELLFHLIDTDRKETEEVQTSSFIVRRDSENKDEEDASVGSVIVPQDPMVEEEEEAEVESPVVQPPQQQQPIPMECVVEPTPEAPGSRPGSKTTNKPVVPPLETGTIQTSSGSSIAASARSFIPSILSSWEETVPNRVKIARYLLLRRKGNWTTPYLCAAS